MRITLLVVCSIALRAQSGVRPVVPRTWDESALSDWATPLAGLNLRPTEISSKEYYALPVDNLRTYPLYIPGREPAGYWEMLQNVGPQPLIEPEKLKTETDWIVAGQRVFDQADHIHLRTLDPKLIALARSRVTFEKGQPRPDGTVGGMRWIPTKQGVALGFRNCGSCHEARLPDGTSVPGAPSRVGNRSATGFLLRAAQSAIHALDGGAPFLMGEEPLGMWLYRASAVPWLKDDLHESLKTFTEPEYEELRSAFLRSGGTPRWNGSLYYPAKIPDLIGIKDRKYIDHTATHLHRGIGDLMRYAALVSFAETADFGPYHMLDGSSRRAQARLSDEALYALAQYIYSLKPPRNPNPFDEQAKAGQKIFEHENCGMCHTPPVYTSNKLTLAMGFHPPREIPSGLDVLRVSVGTDPGLALRTRKGTGYYKVPSLRGVWYRGHYLHDGSVTSLEEMFDPERVKETHVPGGWIPRGAGRHAISGHEFGLKLGENARKQLIAFLRTL